MRRALLTAVMLASACGTAAAHVEVLPARVEVGTAQEFTIRVPTEGQSPTTAVSVRIPSQIVGSAIAEPPAGWTVEPVVTSGALTGIELSGGRIAPGRYQDFQLTGTPTREGTAVWRVVQRFADGTKTDWTAAPQNGDAAEPAPGGAGPAAAITIGGAAAPGAAVAESDDSSAGIWLGVVAIGIAALAALGTGLLWSNRPMRLPEDE